jgi:hypothetical protein
MSGKGRSARFRETFVIRETRCIGCAQRSCMNASQCQKRGCTREGYIVRIASLPEVRRTMHLSSRGEYGLRLGPLNSCESGNCWLKGQA